MSLHILEGQGKNTRRINPAYILDGSNLVKVWRETMVKLANPLSWPSLFDLCRKTGVSAQQLARAAYIFSKFLQAPAQAPNLQAVIVLKELGWFNLPEAARMTVMAQVGIQVTRLLFAGACDGVEVGQPPPLPENDEIIQMCNEIGGAYQQYLGNRTKVTT
jgi:hypothetical protein